MAALDERRQIESQSGFLSSRLISPTNVVAITFDKMINDLTHVTNFNEKALYNYKYIFNIAQQQLKLTVNLRNTFHWEFITIIIF